MRSRRSRNRLRSTQINQTRIPNRLSELRLISQPHPRNEIDIKHGWPMCTWVVVGVVVVVTRIVRFGMTGDGR